MKSLMEDRHVTTVTLQERDGQVGVTFPAEGHR